MVVLVVNVVGDKGKRIKHALSSLTARPLSFLMKIWIKIPQFNHKEILFHLCWWHHNIWKEEPPFDLQVGFEGCVTLCPNFWPETNNIICDVLAFSSICLELKIYQQIFFFKGPYNICIIEWWNGKKSSFKTKNKIFVFAASIKPTLSGFVFLVAKPTIYQLPHSM